MSPGSREVSANRRLRFRGLRVAAVLPAVLLVVGCAAPEQGAPEQISTTAAKDAESAKPERVAHAEPAAENAAVKQPGCATPKAVNVPQKTTPDGKHPKLVIENEVSEAEPVWPSNMTKHKFKLSNAGEAPLHIRLKGG